MGASACHAVGVPIKCYPNFIPKLSAYTIQSILNTSLTKVHPVDHFYFYTLILREKPFAHRINAVPESIHDMYELHMVVQVSFVLDRWLSLRLTENVFEEVEDFLQDAAV